MSQVLALQVSEEMPQSDASPRALGHVSKIDRRYYFFVGRSNIYTVFNILNIRRNYLAQNSEVTSILDFGCGYGRVTRWLRAGFPNASLSVTDVDRASADWCAAHLGCRAIDLALPERAFDLIWVGSVFTHLPAHLAEPLLERLLRAVMPNGVLALTTLGRSAVMRMADFDWNTDKRDWMHFSLERERFERVLDGYHRDGYGYVDYAGQKDYGICIAKGSWYSDHALRSDQYVQLLFQEKADSSQDVSAFMRTSASKSIAGPLLLAPLEVGARKSS